LRTVSANAVRVGSDREDLEQLVYKTHLVLDVRLAGKAMSSADHPHNFEGFDGSGCRLHPLKAPCRANGSLDCCMIRLNDVVQLLARVMLGRP